MSSPRSRMSRARRVVSASLATLLTTAFFVAVPGVVEALAPKAVAAGAPIVYIDEPLTTSSTKWVRNSSSGWSTADCFTAASAPSATYPAVGKCVGTPPAPQPDGQGDLTLMPSNIGASQAWHTTSFPTGRAVEASWNSYIWGANPTEGDSVNMILAAVNPSSPARPTTIGPVATDATQGVANTWMTFLQDVSGWAPAASYNWNSPTCTWAGLAVPQTTPGLTVRGPQGTKGNCPMSRTATVSGAFNQKASATRPATPTKVLVGVNPTNAPVTLSNGVVLGAGRYWFGNSNVYAGSAVVAEGDLPTVTEMNNAGFNTAGFSGWLDPSGRYPKRLMIGFSAANNGNRQNSSINQLSVTSLDTTPLPVWDATLGSSLVMGNSASSVSMTPTLSEGPDPSTPTFTVTLPAGLTGPTWTNQAVAGYTCSSSGQTYTCTYPGTPTAPIAVGALPALSIPVTMAAAGSGTISGTVYSSQTQDNTTTTKSLAATWGASTFVPSPSTAGAGQSITYAVSGLPSGGPGTVTVTDGATTLCSFSVSNATSCASTTTPIGPRTVTATWSGNAPYATQTWTQQVNVVAGQPLASETFRDPQVASPADWTRTATNVTGATAGCLEGGTNTAQTPFPGCSSNFGSTPGDHALAINSLSSWNQTVVANHVPSYPTARGLEVTYNARMWSTSGGGDHIYLRAYAANPAGTDTLPAPDAQMYYNLALDSYGASADSNSNFTMSANCPSRGLGAGVRAANSITIRGPGGCWLGYQQGATGWLSKVGTGTAEPRPTPIKVTVAINPTSTDLMTTSGRTVPAGKLLYAISGQYNGVPGEIIQDLPTAAQITSVGGFPAGWQLSNGTPQRLRFGFLAYGGAPMNKDIQDYRVSTLSPTALPVWSTALDPASPTLLTGGTTTLTVVPTLSGGPDPSSPTVTVTLPAGASAPASFTSGTAPSQYSCTTSGQVVTCTYPGSQTSPIPVGALPALEIPVTVAANTANATVPVALTIRSSQSADKTAQSSTANVTIATAGFTASPSIVKLGDTVTYTLTGATTGTVDVTDGATPLCSFTLPTTSCSAKATVAGQRTVTATWNAAPAPVPFAATKFAQPQLFAAKAAVAAGTTMTTSLYVAPGTLLVNEPLSGPNSSLWQRIGTSTAINYECWTAASATTATAPAIGKCPAAVNTYPDGQGSLRLTDSTAASGIGTAYHMVSVPTGRALEVAFDSYMFNWPNNGVRPGAGTTLIMEAVNPASPARPTAYGSGGGDMGYRAVPYSYLGFNIDLEGNFARSAGLWGSPNCTGTGAIASPANGNPNSLVVRGPQGTSMGNCLYSHTASAPGGTFDAPGNASTNRQASPVRVLAAVNPTNADVTLSNGIVVPAGQYWFGAKDLYNGVAPMSTSGALPTAAAMSNVGIPLAWLDSTGRYPSRLMLGFSGTNGSQTEVKEIANVAVSTLDTTPFPVWDLVVSAGANGALVAGNSTNVISVTPTLSGGPDTSKVTFTTTLPAGLTAPASFTSGTAPNQYSCTTSAQVVTCTYPGSPASPIAVGTLTALAIPVTLTAAGTGTVTASVLSGQTATGTAVTKTTTATWVNQPVLVPSPAVSTKGTGVTYAVNGLPASAGTVTVTVGGVTVCTFDAATTNSCASTTTPVGHQAATATWTGNSPLTTQTFVNTVTVKAGTIFIGSALNAGSATGWERLGNNANYECLTAASAPTTATTPAIQKCGTAPNTWADGLGTLRMDNIGVSTSAVYNTTSIPAGRALEFTFDSHMWAGSNPPGSATTLILAIPDPTNPKRPTVYGTGGGSLAYPNIPNTYLGFALASESANSVGWGGATCRTVTGTATNGELAVFGPQNGGKGACLFSRAAVGNANIWQSGGTRPATPNRLLAAINPTSSSVTLSNGVVLPAGKYWFGIKDLYNGVAAVSTTGDLPTVAEMANVGVTTSYLDSTKQYPQRLMLGFGATGTGANSFKDISNIAASGFDATLPDWSLAVTDTGGGNLIAGNAGNKILVTPTLSGAPDPSSPTFTVTLPTGLTAPASFTSGSYTCTTSGQVVTCTYPGTIAAPIPVGALPTLQVPVTTTASGTGTVTATAYSSQTQTNATVTKTATTTWATTTLTGVPDLTSQGQTVTYAVTGLPTSATGTITVTSGGTTLCTIALSATSCTATNTPVSNATPITATLTGSNFGNQTWTTTVQVRVGPIFSDERLTGATADKWYRLGPDAGIECLTASNNTTATPIPGCSSTALNPVGQGAMRLNHNLAQAMRGTVFHTPTFPTTQGLEVSWDNYFYNTTASGTDESIIIRGVDPANPTNNPSANEPFSKNQYVAAYLDVTGAVNNANWSGAGAGCPLAGNAANVRDSLVFRGPGNGTVTTGTYCWLGGTAAGPAYFFFAGSAARPAPVRVTFAMNPTAQTLKTTSGVSLPAGKMLLAFTGGYATPSTGQLMADLPSAALVGAAAGFGTGWALPNGTPKRVQIGLHSFSSAFDYSTKEFNNLVVNSLAPAGAADWSVAITTNVADTFVKGNTTAAKVTLTPTLSGSADPTTPTFTATLPTGLTPPAWSNTAVAGYTCSTSGQVVTCTYPGSLASPIPAGARPALDIPVTVATTAPVGAATITATSYSSQTQTITTPSYTKNVTITALAATASPTSSTYGDTTTLTLSGLPSTATGTITFTAGGVTLCTATASSGTATCTANNIPAGAPTTVTATWGPESPWAAQSATTTVTVAKATPTLTASGPASVTYGTAATLTATLAPTTATGTVTFAEGGTTICTATVTNGTATCDTSTTWPRGAHTVTATYSGDANHNAATSAEFTVNVVSRPPTVTLTVTPASVAYGTSSTLTLSGFAADATGTVTFHDGATTLCTGTVSSGTATCPSVTTLPVGSYSVVGSYPGDANYASVDSAAKPLTVTQATPTVTASAAPANPAYGDVLTLSMAGLPAGATGEIVFTEGASELCRVTLPATSCTVSALAVGSHSISASYAGDTNVAAASASTTVLVVKAATSMTALATPATVEFGSPVTLSVSGLPTGATGTVSFVANPGNTTLCAASATVSNGAATCDSSTVLPVGSYTIDAVYGGDGNHVGTTATTSLTVTKVTPTLTATAMPASAPYGTSVSIAVTGLPAGAGGTLTIGDGPGTTWCTLDVTQSTTCATPTTLAVGDWTAAVAYSGDDNTAAATTSATFNITKATPTIAPTLTPNPATPGQTVTLIVPGLTGATGTLTVTDADGAPLCTLTLPGTVCQFPAPLADGTYAVSVAYSGDANHEPASGSADLSVGKVAVTITASVTPSTVAYPGSATLSVSGIPAGSTGTVEFRDAGGALLCSLDAATQTTCTTAPGLAVGDYVITATYAGDVAHTSATAAAGTLTVTPRASSITVTANPATVPFGSTSTLSAAGLPAGATGTITVTDGVGGATLCGPVTLPATSCATSATLAAGTYSVVASYSGDGNTAGSTSAPATLTVAAATVAIATTVSPAARPYGSFSTLSVSGLPSAATGSVTYAAGGVTLCSATVSAAAASCLTSTTLPVGTYSVVATYSGDANHAGAAAAPVTLTVTPATATLSVKVSPSSVPYGTSSSLTVSGIPVGGTGGVTFTNATTGAVLCTTTLPTTSCTTSTTLPAGSYDVIASWPGDANYAATTSATSVPLTVTKLPTTVTATVTPASITYGQQASFALTGVPAGAVGSVTFTAVDGTVLCGATLPTTTCATASTLAAGTYSVTGSWSGDGNHDAASAAPVTLTVTPAATSITLAATPTSVNVGETSVLTVTGLPAGATGTVTIAEGGTTLCTLTLPTQTCTSPADLAIGGHSLTATYAGDGNHAAATSAAVTLTVTTITTAVVGSATPDSVPFGTVTTLAATGLPSTATGTVTFRTSPGGTTLCAVTLPDTMCTTSDTLAAGTYPLEAAYSGDSMHLASTSPTFTLTVTPATTTFTAIATPATFAYGTAVPLLEATGLPAGASGAVTFTDATGANLCTLVLPDLSCTTGLTLAVGTHQVTATYTGDGNHSAATAGPVTITVTTAATTTTALTSAGSTAYGTPVTVSAALSPSAATGTMTVRDNATGAVLCTAILPAGCETPATLSVGDHQLVVTYEGDGTYAASTSAVVILTVTKEPTTLGVSVSPATTTYGTPATATVTGLPAGATGTIEIIDATSGAVLATIPAGSSSVTLPATLAVGSYAVQARYPGDDTHAASTSTTTPLAVNRVTPTATTSASPTSVARGSTTTFTLAGIPAGASGTVTFTDQTGAVICTATLPSTWCTGGDTLAGGTHQVIGSYSGDANTAPASSPAQPITVTAAPISPAPTLTLAPGSVQAGGTVTASLSGMPADATGLVGVLDANGVVVCSYTLSAQTSCTVTAPTTAGSANYTARYAGDPNWAGVTTAPATLTVTPMTTSMTATASPSPLTFGGALTLSATGLPSAATGSVSFVAQPGNTPLCTAPVGATISCVSTVVLPVGSYTIEAVYTGDANHAGTVATTPLSVVKAASTVALAAAPASVTYGSSSVLTASGLPATAGGSVTFTDGTTVLCNAVPVTNGTATCTTPTTLTGGTHPITATYSGDDNLTGSTATADLVVTPVATSMTATSAPSTVLAGAPVTVTVTGLPAGATGTITVTDDTGATVCTIPAGSTSCTGALAATEGPVVLAATYSGDANHAASTAPAGTVTVQVPPSPLVVDQFGDSSVYGTPAVLTVAGLPASGTGTVTIADSTGAALCTFVLPASSCAAAANLGAGSYAITASWPGDATHAASTSPVGALVVDKAPVALAGAVDAGVLRFPYGTAVPLTATGLAADATGSITFYGSILCSATLPTTDCSTSPTLPVAIENAHVEYSGDANYLPATSAIFVFEIYKVEPVVTPTTASTTLPGATVTYGVQPIGPEGSGTGTVSVVVDGVEVCVITLPATTCTAPAPTTPGAHQVEYRYSGDSNLLPASATGTLTVLSGGQWVWDPATGSWQWTGSTPPPTDGASGTGPTPNGTWVLDPATGTYHWVTKDPTGPNSGGSWVFDPATGAWTWVKDGVQPTPTPMPKPKPSDEIAFTGAAAIGPLLFGALGLILAGLALVLTKRRRGRPTA